MKVRHILLPTDFSEEARRAYAPVAELARAQGAKVTMLHILPVLALAPHGAPFAPPLTTLPPVQDVEHARAQVKQEATRLGAGLDVSAEVLSEDGAARAIAHYAARHGVDLIALSTHGRTGFRRMMLGSVAEELLRSARVPVLCFPRPE